MTIELFYSHILNILNSSFLHTRRFKNIDFSDYRYLLTKNGFADPNSLWVFQDTGLKQQN